jgi:4-hydroxybenzoate polyprenyltransferase
MPRWLWTALDYLFLLRPLLMPPVWTIGLLGFGQGQRAGGLPDGQAAVVALGLFTLLTGGVYAQNQIYDVEGDRANRKLFLLAEGYIPVASAARFAYGCFIVALAGAWGYAPWLGVLMSVAAFMGVAYNTPPLRWKDRPVAGFVYNVAVYGVIVFITGWGAAGRIGADALLQAVPYCLGVGAIYLNTTLPDIPGDRTTGKITIGVKYGFRRTAVSACILLAAGVATGAWLRDAYIAVPSLACLPFFIRMARSGRVEDAALATKLGVLALSLAAVAVWPAYLIVLIVLFYGARPYYKHRFGMTYPSFRYQR